ncbi:Polyketide synthase enoylreductase [Penicillium robsamsonii]|uniref:Polyketide synthase enoylreductase n=1 Tax=Penicillium robsamsonii TaxID=1792511 RepID=UPI002547C46A|nr:Polyketide synthase enoylreductase [Penicillium robsamsonii]KAJ5835689.1 Polyketide synthase enoylreductase [Penicillium robsamsonii]
MFKDFYILCILRGKGLPRIQAVQIAKAFGLRPIVVDAGSKKRDRSLKMGAEHFVDFKEFLDTVP